MAFLALAVSTFVVYVIVYVFKREYTGKRRVIDFPVEFPNDRNRDQTAEKDWYDVVIVGAGPAGSTCAYFLAKFGWRCLLLEKEKFPRDKCCGDAVCKTAIEILMEMGVYEQLIKENRAYVSGTESMYSPGGISVTGRSQVGVDETPAALSCKRVYLDEALAMAAKSMGADLREGSAVSEATFDSGPGLWSITVQDTDTKYKARVLVCCDGAPSRLATQLGIVAQPSNTAGSHAYVEGGTHNFKEDRAVFYNTNLLPGYSALVRHPNDVLNFCTYIIPGNQSCRQDNLSYWQDYMVTEDANVGRALGSDVKMEPVKAGSIRLSGVEQSYDRHCLVVGDAAGMVDPLTGQGIHHAMEGGQIAAQFLDEVITHGNYDKEVMALYQQRWMDKFGLDFKWSHLLGQMIYRYPILLDASIAAMRSKGDKILHKWADIMTGRVPKLNILRPEFSGMIMFELLRLIFYKMIGKSPVQDKKT